MLKQIGKYTISERIGRGTYSRVYRAVDPQGKPVAIKVSTTQTEPQHLNEFQKDLVAAASVLHPSLVSVHDLGFEDDFPYLVMELVEGHDLAKLLKSNNAPSLAERIRVMQQIGEALKSAHERSVYHLDIRPSKIMLCEDGTAKLLDLGLGRLSFDPARVTENGYLLGAPFYMSPERLTAIDTADERCDIWSFGVTFYEWVSGRHPFYDDDGDRMIGNIMDATPAALANVPGPLNEVIFRALEKEPADRYQNFVELLTELKPRVSDLKREESDALMAEALKQTDSGRWHEARRIARQMRDLQPQQAASSQMFGFSEQELEKEKIAERVRPAAAAAASAKASAAAVDTPEPAPPPFQRQAPQSAVQPPAVARQTQPSVVSTPNPQRPERTTPKIPAIGVRNGVAAGENGSPAPARVRPVGSETNGAPRVSASAAAAPAKPALVREMESSTAPKRESTRTRPPSNPRVVPPAPPAPASQEVVRILAMDEPSGFPWLKIFAFAIPVLLIIGALFFFWQPKPSNSSEEAKAISPASRVIKGDHADAPKTTVTPPETASGTGSTTPPAAAAANGQPITTITTTASGDPANPTTPPGEPKAFDPKSLLTPKAPAPSRRRGNGGLAGVAPPALGGNADGIDSVSLPVALAAPPPPAPAAAAAATSPAPAVSSTASAPAPAPDADGHVGGLFVQPVLLHSVQPVYPASAVQTKTQGTVRFQATIAKDGSVKNVQLLSGDPLLSFAAKQAVIKFKYRPATLNGEPLEVTQQIVLKFNLNNQ